MWMRRWDYQHWTVESGLDGGDAILIQLIWGNAEYLFHVSLETAEAIGQPSSSETCGQKGSIKPGILRHMNLPSKASHQWTLFLCIFWVVISEVSWHHVHSVAQVSPESLTKAVSSLQSHGLAFINQVFEGFETIDSPNCEEA